MRYASMLWGNVKAFGPQGTQGEQGPQGYQGRQGDQGVQGPQGHQGVTGDQGVQGETGEQGPQGFQGETGPQGATGSQGPQGFKGDKGDTGDQGPQGVQGETGAKGDTGDQGPQGVQGVTGAQGPQGHQGEVGNTGPQGHQGYQGPQGATGSQGATGAQGEKGDIGPQGPQGEQGETGVGYYNFINSVTESNGTVQLVGDEASPGGNQVYGTDVNGNKGWESNLWKSETVSDGDIQWFRIKNIVGTEVYSDGYFTGSNFCLSSARAGKKDIRDIENLSKYDLIKIIQFHYKKDEEQRKRLGVIAEDIAEIAPELIYGSGDKKTVAYIDLLLGKVALLESKIKELERRASKWR